MTISPSLRGFSFLLATQPMLLLLGERLPSTLGERLPSTSNSTCHGGNRTVVAEGSGLIQEAGKEKHISKAPTWMQQVQRMGLDRYTSESDWQEEVALMELMIKSWSGQKNQKPSEAASDTARSPTSLAELHSKRDVTEMAQLLMKKICLLGKATMTDQESGDPEQMANKYVTTLMIKKFAGIKQIRDFGGAVARAWAYSTNSAFRALLTANDEYNRQLKEDYGFDWAIEKAGCDAEVSEQNLVQFFERLKTEVEVCDWDKDKNCVEMDDKFCPEGFASAYRRGFNAVKAAAAAPLGYAIGWTSTALGGIIVGALVVNPVSLAGIATGAAAGFAFQACCVPVDFLIAGAFSAYMGTESAACKCFETNCRLESDTGKCEVLAVDNEGKPMSENPFGWLPYPGKRCDWNPTKQACELVGCKDDDYVPEISGGFFGTVGHIDDGSGHQSVANCVSSTAGVSGALVRATDLNGKENNPVNRNEVYTQLGLAEKPYEEVAFTPDTRFEQKPPALQVSDALLLPLLAASA